MSRLLEKALAEVRKLPETDQDAIASIILAEMEDDARWDEAFANSQGALETLAAKTRADIQAGRVKITEMDQL